MTCFICCSHLLSCLINSFPFYGVTTSFAQEICTNLHSPPTKSEHLTSWTKLWSRKCHLSRAYIWESVDLGGFGWVDMKVSGFRRWVLGVGMRKPEDFHSECLFSMKEQSKQIEKHRNQLIQSILRPIQIWYAFQQKDSCW